MYEAKAFAQRLKTTARTEYIHAYDDRKVIAGQARSRWRCWRCSRISMCWWCQSAAAD